MNSFLFKMMDSVDSETAKNLVGKHIHFTYHNKDEHVIETLPGKVLSYDDGILKIYTMDILFDDSDDKDNNKFIKEIELRDISNVFVFDKYNKNFYALLDGIGDEDLINNQFEIINVFGNKIISKILDYENSLSIKIKIDDKEYDYPTYLIESIKVIEK